MKKTEGTKPGEKVIRIESLCGFRPSEGHGPLWTDCPSSDAPQTVVIDDAALGIRERAAELIKTLSALPKGGTGKVPWIVLKVAWPVLENPLLASLAREWGQRLIIVTPIDDLRRDNIQISRGLSWERTAQDLSWEYDYNPRMKTLAGVRALVVPIGLSGVWLSRADNRNGHSSAPEASSTLVYDPCGIEGDWEKDRPGLLLGYTSCLTLGILHSLLTDDRASLVQASRRGLSAMRALHTNGYHVDSARGTVELPIAQIRQALDKPEQFPSVSVPLGYRHYSVPVGAHAECKRTAEWSILKATTGSASTLFDLAMQIVRNGADQSLGAIPFARFGGLLTVDKDEIEGFRTTHDLIAAYCRSTVVRRPLSIAVFGPPGSGKSYGVAQVAEAVASTSGTPIKKITFNVSQFTCQEDLVDAFHRVRDIGLSGKIPLVFWDEFDSSLGEAPLFWLKAFLAPMQDGEFTQGQITHPIGRAIFIFAGATASSVDELGLESPADNRAAKVPDFKSRLRGCINMVGIDRISKKLSGTDEIEGNDPQYVVRRAIILRSIIERIRPDVIAKDKRADIDAGLLKALLSVWSFKHGVRSLESIIDLCHRGDGGVLHRSSLPPRDVLALHVDTAKFLGLITADVEFQGNTLETLASAHHEMYRKKSPQSRLAALPYEKLSDEDKDKNRAAVRGIPHKLASIGFVYQLQHSTNSASSDTLSDTEAEQLGRLDHDRWIVAAIDDGYVYGLKRDDAGFPKKHPDLVPWVQMDEQALKAQYPKYIASKLGPGPLKNSVDMEMARQIPEIMQHAGYRVTRM